MLDHVAWGVGLVDGRGFWLGLTFPTLDDAHGVGSCYYLRILKKCKKMYG